MQLSSRILTALAVLILAVAVVAVRAGSSGTVEAATGTIDVLNVGTCYTTSTDAFGVGDCDDGDGAPYDVADRDTITETGMVYATYAHDPKTAADSPRGVLVNSNLIKISIKDSDRDKRTPVLLGAGDTLPCSHAAPPTATVTGDNGTPNDLTDDPKNIVDRAACVANQDTATAAVSGAGNEYYGTHLTLIQKDYPGIAADPNDFRWNERGVAVGTAFTEGASGTEKVLTGITIDKNVTAVPDNASQPYRPMFVVDGDDSPISLYGLIGVDDPAAPDGVIDDAAATTTTFVKLNKYLAIDEDVGSGRITNETGNSEAEVAPWFSVKVLIPDGQAVEVMYVVYETSEFESLVGGATEGAFGAAASTTAAPTANNTGLNLTGIDAPDFTTSERRSPDTQLVVEARSDGRDSSQHLVLRETERFSGTYEGYLKLTDENGNNGTGAADNWGMATKDGTPCTDRLGCSDMEAAILGVESGPVVVAYKDTDGATQLLEIAIDTVPPAVQIDQPVHEVQIQDLSPEFSGSYTDVGSGLRKDSFRAYVDHRDDANENGVNANYIALDLAVDTPGGAGSYGYVGTATGKTAVESVMDYTGFGAPETDVFGVIPHADVFNVDVEPAGTNNIVSIDGDTHDDGATSGTFGNSVRIDFLTTGDYNNTIDFQALVADVAGNIGFSDSDTEGPRFINNLGETDATKRNTERYNVLGWYARHIFFLDEVDPAIFEEQSVTGFYGENDKDVPQPNRSGILIAFDRAVDPDSIGLETFTVTLDPTGGAGTTGEAAQIIDVDPQGRAVYLLLNEELASDATPEVDIATGQWVSDPAGNRLTGGNQAAFDVKDGIAPKITVALSDGSGSGEDAEGPAMLTKDSIIVTITADEEINSTPSLVVVCSDIGWGRTRPAGPLTDNDKALSDLVKSRSGSLNTPSANFSSPDKYDCGDASSNYEVTLQQAQSYSRPGLEWEYQWVNFDSPKALQDGKLSVVAYARDRQSFTSLDAVSTVRGIDDSPTPANKHNWGAGTAEFRYDITLDNPEPTPADEATITEDRPFVMLTYKDASTISVDEFKIDGTVQEMQVLGGNRFLYWPDSLGDERGAREVSVKASDAAGNEDIYDFSFTWAERKDFGLKLIAGWNAVSFPANPMDPMIENVFTDASIDMVAGWDSSDPEKPWSIATRMEDEWSTSEEYATLNKIHAQYGYWVHSQGFTTQRVKLVGGIDRTDPSVTPADLVTIPTLPGWNFVGVIDQDGDQTQDDFGEDLMNRDADGTQVTVTASDYLGSNKRAYTWDPIRAKFDIIGDGDSLQIGDGIWVYYGGGIAP